MTIHEPLNCACRSIICALMIALLSIALWHSITVADDATLCTGRLRHAATLTGHSDQVRQAVFSPDGKLLASCSYDGTIRLWNTNTWQEVANIKGSTDPIYAVLFTSDGNQLVSGGQDGIVRIWNTISRTEEHKYDPQSGAVVGISRLAGGRNVAVRFVDRRLIQVLNVDMHRVEDIALPDGLHGSVTSLAAFGTKPCVVVGSSIGSIGTLRLDNREDRQLLYEGARAHRGPDNLNTVMSLAVAGNDSKLAWSLGFKVDSTVVIWDLVRDKERKTLNCRDGTIWSIAFTPNGRRLATAGKQLIVWDVESGRQVAVGDNEGNESSGEIAPRFHAYSLAFSPNGKWLASVGVGHDVAIWNADLENAEP